MLCRPTDNFAGAADPLSGPPLLRGDNVSTMTVVDDNYTGHVEPRTAARRTLPGASIVKVSVGPMDNNAYLVTCSQTGETLLIDAANDAEILLELIERYAPKLSLIVTSHQHQDHWLALEAVAKATGVPTAAHQLDSEPLPVKPDRCWPTATPSRSGSCPSTSSTCRATPPDPSRWRSMAPTRRRGHPPVHRRLPVPRRCRKDLEARRFRRNCLPMSPVGCSTSTRTRRWSTPGTATTRPWARNARTWANGGSGVGDPVKATLTFRKSSR